MSPHFRFKCPNCHDEVLPEDERPCWKCGKNLQPAGDLMTAPSAFGLLELNEKVRRDESLTLPEQRWLLQVVDRLVKEGA